MGCTTHPSTRELDILQVDKDQANTPQCFHQLTVNPHLQVSSDPADQVGGRSLLATLGRHRFVRADLQQQHLVQHHLPQLRGELGNKLQAGREKLPCMSKVLREQETWSRYLTFLLLVDPLVPVRVWGFKCLWLCFTVNKVYSMFWILWNKVVSPQRALLT